jgi:hypothetical protein
MAKARRSVPAAKERDPIPECFGSLQEAADFWDEHDVVEYEDLIRPAHFEVALEHRNDRRRESLGR